MSFLLKEGNNKFRIWNLMIIYTIYLEQQRTPPIN